MHTRGRKTIQLGAGEVVGELRCSVRTARRTARVQATSPVRCLALDRRSFRRLLESEPKLALELLETLAERLAASS